MADELQNSDAPLSFSDAVASMASGIDHIDERGNEVAKPPEKAPREKPQAEPEEEDDEAIDLDEDEGDEVDTDDDEEGEEQADDGEAKPDTATVPDVDDNARVRMADGTFTTVAKLKEGTLLQAEFTRKSQAHARDVETFKAEKAQVSEYVAKVNDDRKFVATLAQNLMPQAPDDNLLLTAGKTPEQIARDSNLHQRWTADYQRQMRDMGVLTKQIAEHEERQKAEIEEALVEARRVQADKLIEVRPEFKDPKVQERFWSNVDKYGAHYGATREDVAKLTDHRDILVVDDAMKYRRLMEKKALANKKTANVPPMLQGSERRNTDQVKLDTIRAADKKLNKTHSFKDGLAALIAREKGA